MLVVDDVRTHFRTSRGLVRAVDGVSFTLDGGRTLGIVGESGSGKTVLSRSIMGLLPKRHTETPTGQVLFKGNDLRAAPRKELQRIWGCDVAVVFQDPMTSLNPVMKIGKQMTESMRHHLHISQSEANVRAVELLRSVDINEPDRRLEQYPHQLSGGMRQRVTIAMALGCSPELLIADEPTTALDVTVQAQILDLLQAQQRQRNMAMIIVTHDLGVVAGRTDEIMVMYAGQVVEKAPTRELFTRVRMPYTEALLQSIPRIEDNVDTRLKVIPGRPPDLTSPPKGCRFAPRCSYTQTKCLEEPPPLVSEGDHQYRCWFPIGTSLEVDPPTRRDGALAPGVVATAGTVTTGGAD
ncbi:MAG: ABC transporter ATP-binding protein [Ilumatobacter sp.]|nr:MAG: ABC transporter ATP-binding protein [Ilumatobacter sp.]